MLLLQPGQTSIHTDSMSMDQRLYAHDICGSSSSSLEYPAQQQQQQHLLLQQQQQQQPDPATGYLIYPQMSPETSPPHPGAVAPCYPADSIPQGYEASVIGYHHHHQPTDYSMTTAAGAMAASGDVYPGATPYPGPNYQLDSGEYCPYEPQQQQAQQPPQSAYYRDAYYSASSEYMPYDMPNGVHDRFSTRTHGYVDNVTASSQSSSSSPCSPQQNYTSAGTLATPTVDLVTAHHRPKNVMCGGGDVRTQKPCAVCGDNAACQHYGVRTCEGCKGFFKRTVQKASKYVCLSNKACTVDKRRRNRCQFCRFQKCLDVGMVKEVVRTASLKGRRGRLPSKPRSPTSMTSTGHMTKSQSAALHSLSSVLVAANLSTQPNASHIDYSMFSEMLSQEVKCETNGNHVRDIVSESMQRIRTWAYNIPCYGQLCPQDQSTLFDAAAPDLLALRVGNRLTTEGDRLIFCSGIVLHRTQCLSTLGSLTDTILHLGNSLKRLDIDEVAFSCLLTLSLITNRPGLVDSPKVEEFEMRVIDALRDHCKFNQTAKPQYFQQVMSILSDIRTHNSELATPTSRPHDRFVVGCSV